MKKFHVSANGKVEPCRATQRACPRGGDDKHYSTREDAIQASLIQQVSGVTQLHSAVASEQRISESRVALLQSGASLDLLAQREEMAARVPLCFRRFCYEPVLSARTERILEADDPEAAAFAEANHIAQFAPRSLAPYYTPAAVYEENDDSLFAKEWAAHELVFTGMTAEQALGTRSVATRSKLIDAIGAMAEPDFELDTEWYSSTERATLAAIVPDVLSRLEDEVDEARVYEMMRTA